MRWVGLLRCTLAAVIAFAAGAAAMHFGMHAEERKQTQSQAQEMQALRDQLAVAQAAEAGLRSQADIAAGTQRALQENIKTLQAELGHTRDQLAFYEELIPAGPGGAVAIRGLEIRPDGGFLHYRVLLTRKADPNAPPFKGRLRFVAHGLLDGKNVKMELSPPVADTPGTADGDMPADDTADPLALVFEQFQRSTGVLQAIPGMDIQSVTVEILEDGTVRATRNATLNRPDESRTGAAQ